MKTVFYGNSNYVVPILKALDPVLIVTTEKNLTDPVIDYAIKNQITYLSVKTLSDKDILGKISTYKTDAAVLADFGLIIPETILSLYTKGIVNIHPSLLPKYRGPTPVQSALLNNDLNTGVTLIKLDNDVDHGPIIAQKKVTLLDNDTTESAYTRLFHEGSKLLIDNLEKYMNGKIHLTEQIHTDATFTNKLIRESGYFNITNPPSIERLNRMIHAYYPWPSTWSKVQMANNEWRIVKFLPEGKLQMEGKKPVSFKDFYNGYPELRNTIEKVMSYEFPPEADQPSAE